MNHIYKLKRKTVNISWPSCRQIISISYNKSSKFTSTITFIKQIEDLLLDFYHTIVQDLKTWKKPAPKLQVKKELNKQET